MDFIHNSLSSSASWFAFSSFPLPYSTIFSWKTSLGQYLCTGWSSPWYYSPSVELFPKHRSRTTVGFCNSLQCLCIHTHRAPQVRGTEKAIPLYELSEWSWTNAATLKTAEGKLEVRLTVQKDKKYPSSCINTHSSTLRKQSVKEHGMLILGWLSRKA